MKAKPEESFGLTIGLEFLKNIKGKIFTQMWKPKKYKWHNGMLLIYVGGNELTLRYKSIRIIPRWIVNSFIKP